MLSSPRALLGLAGGSALGLLLLAVLSLDLASAASLDSHALSGFASLEGPRIEATAHALVHLADPAPLAVLMVLVLGAAVAQGRPRHALGAGALVLGACATTQLLKPLLAEPRSAEIGGIVESFPGGFPSGHATAAMSLALAAVIVTPRYARPFVAFATGLFAAGVSLSLLVLGWHFPSDVVGGYLVATVFCFLVLAALRAAPGVERAPSRGVDVAPAVGLPFLGIAAAAAMLAVALVLPRADGVASYAQSHPAAVAAGTLVLLSCFALLAAVTAAAMSRR
jgi:membrane-associated phospholipid phosphatase